MSRVLDLLNSFQSRSPGVGGHPGENTPGPAWNGFPLSAGASFVSFYRLKENPFADAIDLAYYFQTAAQQRACQQLYSTVADGISLGLLTGPSGSGKTLVTQILLEHLDPALYQVILVLVTPGMSRTILLEEMARELGIEKPPLRSRELLTLLHRSVIDLHQRGRRLVVLIDEAHFLSADALHTLRTISNLEVPGRKLATCLLFAEEAFLRRLRNPRYRSLTNRMFHKTALAPMSADETIQYIKYRLMSAGDSGSLLDDGACRAVAARSGGIHREVNRLCYLALVEGARGGRAVVSPDLIEGSSGAE